MFSLSTVATLPNGATIMERNVSRGVVLCRRDTVHQPFVTWRVDGDGNAFWGHYFDDETEARQDYFMRCNQ
jgi:hypothetical protein